MQLQRLKQKFIRGTPGNVLASEYFYFETKPDFRSDLAIVCGGWERCQPDYQVMRNSYPYYVIKYTIAGKGTFTVHDQTFDLSAGTLSIFGPKTPHAYITNPASPLEHIFIIFTGSKAGLLLKQSTISERLAFKVANPADTLYLFKSLMKAAVAKPPYSQQICCAYLQAILLKQVAVDQQVQEQSGDAFNTYLRCKRYLDENFLSIDSINTAANACEVNIRYMARLFGRFCSLSPHEYVMRIRLNKAAAMLLTSDLHINQIAATCGFADPYHFSKAFKKFHNLAPKLYRKLHMNEQ